MDNADLAREQMEPSDAQDLALIQRLVARHGVESKRFIDGREVHTVWIDLDGRKFCLSYEPKALRIEPDAELIKEGFE